RGGAAACFLAVSPNRRVRSCPTERRTARGQLRPGARSRRFWPAPAGALILPSRREPLDRSCPSLWWGEAPPPWEQPRPSSSGVQVKSGFLMALSDEPALLLSGDSARPIEQWGPGRAIAIGVTSRRSMLGVLGAVLVVVAAVLCVVATRPTRFRVERSMT